MRKRLSALGLVVRPSLIPFALLLAAATVIEYFLFARASGGDDMLYLWQIIAASRIEYVFLAVFLLLTVLFVNNMGGGNIDNTLKRLLIDQRETVLIWGLYFSLCYILMIIWQFAVLALFSHISGFSTGQIFLLDCYRVPFLHSLMPLADTSRYFRNIFMALGLGICLSCLACRLRRGQKATALFVLAPFAIFFFSYEMASWVHDVTMIILYVTVTFCAVFNIWEEQP